MVGAQSDQKVRTDAEHGEYPDGLGEALMHRGRFLVFASDDASHGWAPNANRRVIPASSILGNKNAFLSKMTKSFHPRSIVAGFFRVLR